MFKPEFLEQNPNTNQDEATLRALAGKEPESSAWILWGERRISMAAFLRPPSF